MVESNLYSPVLTDGQKLAEAQQQLRQKVDLRTRVLYVLRYVHLEEEELRSSEMERQVIREQLDIAERNFARERQQFQEMRQQVIPVHDKCCFREKLLETPYTYLSTHIACNGQCYALISCTL